MTRRIPRPALLAAAAATTLLLLGCGGGKKQGDGSPTGKPVARVNGEAIHESDVEREITHLAAVMGPSGRDAMTDPAQKAQIRANAVKNLIDRSLLLARAKQDNLLPTDADVGSEIDKLRAQYPDSTSFHAKLAEFSMTESDVANEIRINLCLRRLVEKSASSIPPATTEDAAKYYREHPDQFQSPDEVRASHILIRAAESDPPETRSEARKKAEKVLAEIRSGRDFAEEAKTNSGDPGSAQNGGDLGFFPRGRMVPPFEQAAFALKVGEMSDLVETPFGFHILKVTDRRDARTLPIEEVQDKIVQYLDKTKGDRAIQTLLEEARAKAKIEQLDEQPQG